MVNAAGKRGWFVDLLKRYARFSLRNFFLEAAARSSHTEVICEIAVSNVMLQKLLSNSLEIEKKYRQKLNNRLFTQTAYNF